jgi:hypothetical protein
MNENIMLDDIELTGEKVYISDEIEFIEVLQIQEFERRKEETRNEELFAQMKKAKVGN